MYESYYLCNIKSFIDYSELMKVECLESDSEDDNHQQKVEVKASKNEPKLSLHTSSGKKLDYLPDGGSPQKIEVQGVKAQPKSEVKVLKRELKSESKVKNALDYHGQKQRKKDVDRLAYPPPEKQIPLKTSKLPDVANKTKKILDETAKEAITMIHKMKSLFQKDLQKFARGELAYHKVKYLKTLSEKLSNVYIKKEFIEKSGLKLMEKWLEKIACDKSEIEPSLALKLGLTKILKEMNLTTDQVEKTKYLMSYIQRNRQSQVQELRELSIGLIKQWEYNIMTDNTQTKK